MTRTSPRILLLLFLIAPLGCDQSNVSTQPAELPTVKMKIGSRTFELEVARTSEQQETGLMKRDSMPADHGMIFVFSRPEVQSFWMKDTRIPLDILFLDGGGTIVSGGTMKPYDLNSTSSMVPAQYAIELNAGAVKDAGVKVGDRLTVPAGAQANAQ